MFRTFPALLIAAAPLGAAAKVDPSVYSELASDVLLPPILGALRRTLKDPSSVRDLVLCPPSKVKLKEGRPDTWSVLLSFNAKNSFGGYEGSKMYAAIFRHGRLSGGVNSVELGGSGGLSGLLNDMIAKKMATCPAIVDEKVQQILGPGASIYK